MPEKNQQDAPNSNDQNPAQPPPAKAEPKVEVKDGKVLVDGKSYVKESDLMAAKESLTKQLETAQQTHNSAIDSLKLEVSAAQTEVAKANAALEEAKKARTSGDISAEDLSKAKQEAETAKTELTKAQTANLDYRRKYILIAYNIPPNSDVGKSLADKTPAQLDALEEALKALQVKGSGPGNYAVGGGGSGTTPPTAMDRARDILSKTPYRGTRNEAPNPAK